MRNITCARLTKTIVYLVYILKVVLFLCTYFSIKQSQSNYIPSYIYMAENLPKLQASRAGYRAHLTQTIKKATNIATKEDPLTDSDITSLKRIVDQLARKRSILEELDEKIVGMIEDPKELEKEIFQTEDIKEEINETAAQLDK